MESFLRFLLRLLLVPLGGALAIMVAMTVALIAHWSEIVALAHSAANNEDDWALAFVFTGPIFALLLSLTMLLSAVPAAVGALIAEGLAIRSWIFHALNGGLSAAIGWALMQDDGRQQYGFLTAPKVMVAAGLAGGLTYWLVAGWSAGFWKPVFGREGAAIQPPIPPRAQIEG